MKKLLLQLCLLCYFTAASFVDAQGQANDECSAAVVLVPAGTCNPTAGSITTATVSSGAVSDCEYVNDGDVWYSFTATNTQHRVSVSNISSSVSNILLGYLGVSVYSGACGSLTEEDCSGFEYGDWAEPSSDFNVSGLTIGDTYYIKLWKDEAYDYNFDLVSPGNITFDICVKEPPAPPANDACANAITFPAIPTDGTCVTESGTTDGASGTMAACVGSGTNDVWYKFTATTTTHVFDVTTDEDLVIEVFSGADCNSLTSMECSDPERFSLSGFTIGDTYYVRLYNYFSSSLGGVFDLCIKAPAVAPANDDCANAIAFPAIPADGTCVTESGTTEGGTGTMSACAGSGTNDVWYKFTASATTHIFDVTTDEDLVIEVFSGPDCANLTSLECSDAEQFEVLGLTIGTEYYVRLYNYYSSDFGGIFDFCIKAPPPPPANDECDGAIALTANTPYNTHNIGATQSMAPITCETYTADAANDVWYSITPAVNGTASLLLNQDETDVVAQIFSGDCMSLTDLGCLEDADSTTFAITAGQTYYIRVYDYGSSFSSQGNFVITVNIQAAAVLVDSVVVGTLGNVPPAITTNGGTLQMTATIYPATTNQNVTWSIIPGTGNAAISAGGLVTAESNGTVWAKAVSVADPTMADSMQINISNQVVPIDSVVVGTQNNVPATITSPAGTLQMMVNVYPANANQNVSWSIVPGTGAATINAAGVVTAQANGTVWAKAVSLSDASKSDSVEITISNQTVSVNDVYAKTGIKIYPNPVEGSLFVSFDKVHPALQLSVIDAFGKLVSVSNIAAGPGSAQHIMQLNGLASGSYILRIKGEGIQSNLRFVKK